MSDNRYGRNLCYDVLGFLFGMLSGAAVILVVLTIFDTRFWKDGVVDATRGKATAKLVEKSDGTNEWKVERAK